MKRYILLMLIVIASCLSGCDRITIDEENGSIGIIGSADGPTVIYLGTPKSAHSKPEIVVERITCSSDKDGDGLNDSDDILEGARKDMENKPRYSDGYYDGGYPPDDIGVCTDVIWRAFKNAGYMLKDMVDEDIKNNLELYTRVDGKPDPNIDFRRVKNLCVFFDRYATRLTTEIIPGDIDNLKEWQAGDIVVFDDPMEHIAILSDIRNEDGIPLMIHNSGPHTQENDMLLFWNENLSPITAHYRFPPCDEISE